MTVLFSELLVPGWAQDDSGKIGLNAVTGSYSDGRGLNLPCHNAPAELFFSEKSEEIAMAKSLCGGCPVKNECLTGALSREEPCGIWGGELFEDGRVVMRKRSPGRPRSARIETELKIELSTELSTELETEIEIESAKALVAS
jgi:WhiB family redox-sensing transcriptional regulator